MRAPLLQIIGPILTRISSRRISTTNLKDVLSEKIPIQREIVKQFRKEYGNRKIGDVTVEMVYGGMRGINGLVAETSVVDPEEGIRFRGYSVRQCQELLPKATPEGEPIPEGMFWLLVTGDIPSKEQTQALSNEWASRSDLPGYIVTMLNDFPSFLHPMSQLSAAVTALNSESKFVNAYADGLHKRDYWEAIYEDAMDLIAKLPPVAAIIYQNLYKGGSGSENPSAPAQKDLDWTSNFCKMIGHEDPKFNEFLRLYMTILSDHEGGNVSAHTTHLVGSALADPYLSFGAGLMGFAGPIHGSALREVSRFLSNLINAIGIKPSEEKLKKYIRSVVESGQVVHGCGHAVLKKTDPRFTCQLEFAQKNFPNDPLLKLMANVYKTAPSVMAEIGKIKNPWPNVDACTGSLFEHFGLKDPNYYTVLAGMSRALGTMASLIWDRALELPIERPQSMSTAGLQKLVSA